MVIDLQTLQESAGDDPEFAAELLSLFEEQAEAEFARLADAAACGANSAEIASIAHKLVGSAVACGFVSLAEELRALELLLLKQIVTDNVAERIDRLRTQFEENLVVMTDLMMGEAS